MKNLNYIIRPVEYEDFWRGLDKCLSELSPCKLNFYITDVLFRLEKSNNKKIYVASLSGQIIGTASLLLEEKLIHNGGIVGHIEDVAVLKEYQGCGIGKKLVEYLIHVAKESNCYKCILNCSTENIKFYEKIGFKEYQHSMRLDL